MPHGGNQAQSLDLVVSVTPTPRALISAITSTPNPFIIAPTELPALLPTAPPLPEATTALDSDSWVVGYSAGGRPIVARRLGTGAVTLLFVGGMHGGYEGNTVVLVNELIAHFAAHPDQIHPELSLVFIPAANPDGLIHGRTAQGRFNANGVDLNRNWSCDWSTDARWRDQRVNPGARAFSEPETVALANAILELRPAAALFYHSSAGGVFAGECQGDHGSAAMSAVYGRAAGYSYGRAFSAYRVTGTAASWVDGQGIPSADVELFSWTDSEFERNRRAIMALQGWVTAEALS